MAYATLTELKLSLGIPAPDTADDVMLQISLDAAEAGINRFCQRRFFLDSAPVARIWTWKPRRLSGVIGDMRDDFDRASETPEIYVRDIGSATGLVLETDPDGDGVYNVSWTLGTDFQLLPRNAAADGVPWTSIALAVRGTKAFPIGEGLIRLTARYGWPAVPAQVKAATIIQAARLFKRKDSPFGVAGSPDTGSELRLLSALDPDVQSLVRSLRRLAVT